jgi:hypothetical protein
LSLLRRFGPPLFSAANIVARFAAGVKACNSTIAATPLITACSTVNVYATIATLQSIAGEKINIRAVSDEQP